MLFCGPLLRRGWEFSMGRIVAALAVAALWCGSLGTGASATVSRAEGSCESAVRTPYYVATFEDGAGPEWHPRRVTRSPTGERFLGRFVNRSVELKLRNLPPHHAVRLSVDLLPIMSWDGSHPVDGPDIVRAKVDGQQAAATFSNDTAPFDAAYRQTFPGLYPGPARHPGITGADASETLGYPDVSAYGGIGDSTYTIRATLKHRRSTLSLRITSQNVVDVGVNPIETDESLGVDNVSVRLLGADCPKGWF
jgi:hypothetical protein